VIEKEKMDDLRQQEHQAKEHEDAPRSVPISLGLELADADSESEVARIVASHLSSRGRAMPDRKQDGGVPNWDADYFGLERVKIFSEGNADLQRAILDGCSRTLLNEAYFIEKSGGAYCAKMILLAESTEMRQVYGLIAADEASHLQWIRPWVEEHDRVRPDGAMLRFLANLIEVCDANTLAYLVQVILEGWGLHHYQSLYQSCRDPLLRQRLQAIHKDEALHHHTGEVVFDPSQLDGGQRALVRESLATYCEMVRVGPQAVVEAVDRAAGGLSEKNRVQVFADLDCQRTSQEKLDLLRRLMLGGDRAGDRGCFVAELEEKGLFTPYSPEACASILG
jgi:hypothetical protein